jgi:hypothetical protein
MLHRWKPKKSLETPMCTPTPLTFLAFQYVEADFPQSHLGQLCHRRATTPNEYLFVLLRRAISTRLLVRETVVLLLEAVPLLLQVGNVAVLGFQLLLKLSNLADTTSVAELCRSAALGRWVTIQTLNFLFETKDVKDHDVSAVEDEGKEEGEAAKVHVTLRVELARLNLHTGGSTKLSGTV